MLKTLHRPLVVTGIAMAVLSVVSLAGIFIDDRTLLGVPIWLKPFKFFISTAIYNLTLAWLISLVRDKGVRIAWWLGTIIAVALAIELVVIAGQALRGLRSHFNVSTGLDAALWSIMGTSIVFVWVATAWIGVLLLRQRMPDRANALAIRLGLLIALFGLGVGFLMTSPTAAQLSTGSAPDFVGAHAVGVPDGGPGIPIVNWSTEGGDLRAPHFIGMHALQALPLIAFGLMFLSRRIPSLRDMARRARLVTAFAVFWGGLTVIVTWQALRGQSFIHPDALTWGALAAVVLAAVAIALTAFGIKPNASVAAETKPTLTSAGAA
ncbi:hypothetical protein [Catelliglobosispora koreensis]|uniref:hypothetical protein n=1 Tax=Catelliglobosispora koreensis TaxID=129052 RepID=UPI0003616C78|nr:hypothetical protein [Catelliglobosispora koreensis]